MRLKPSLVVVLSTLMSVSAWADPPLAGAQTATGEGSGEGTGQVVPVEPVLPPAPGSAILPQDPTNQEIVLLDLGTYPFCEASDIVREPYDSTRFLVADNEVSDRLFEFSMLAEGLTFPFEIVVPDENRPRDVEALAAWGNHVLVVGSFDRNNWCRTVPRRQRMRVMEWQIDRFAESGYIDAAGSWLAAIRRPDICVNAFFAEPAPAPAAAFCQLLVASGADEDEDRCEGSLNIEGAVAVPAEPASSDTVRIWLGLRAPLIENKAILARLSPELDTFHFDAMALVDLQGRGIRTLTADANYLWGIGGGTANSDAPSVLFRIPLSSLGDASAIQPEIIRSDLPASAEGLVIMEDRALIVVDGARADNGVHACSEPAQQGWFWLPRQSE